MTYYEELKSWATKVVGMSQYNIYVIKDDTGEYFSFMTWRFYDAATARDKQIEKILWHI